MKRLLIWASGLALATPAAADVAPPAPANVSPANATSVVRLPGRGEASTAAPVATPAQAAPPVKLRQELPTEFNHETQTDRLLSQAADWRERGRKDLSAAALQRALSLQPRNAEALYRRALYAAQDGDVATAQNSFERLKTVVPASDQRLIQVAQLVGGALPLPAPAADVAPRQDPDPGARLRLAGFRELNAQNLAAAEANFAQALRLRQSDRDAAGGLGSVRLRQRRFAEAVPLLERAASGEDGWRWSEGLGTARFYASFDRARVAVASGKLSVAEAALKPLANGNYKDRIEAQLLLADVYYRQRRFNEASDMYRAALQRDPHRGEAIAGLAQTLLQLGDAQGAAKLVSQSPAGVSGPQRARIEDARAKTLAAAGDSFGAGAALAEAVTADPQNPWSRYDYARFLIEHGDAQTAAQVAAPLFNPGASDPDSLQAAALYAEAAGRLDVARDQLARIPPAQRNEAVTALAGRLDVQSRIAQAKALQRQGQTVAAITLLRGLVSQGGLAYGARSDIAQALLSLGDAYGAGALALEAARTPLPAGARPGDAGGFLEVLAATGQEASATALLNQTASAARTPQDQAAWRAMYAGYATRRADRLRESGDLADAYDVLSQALSVAPSEGGLLGALGRLYQAGGRQAEARATFDRLLAAHPQDPSTYLEAARAAVASRDFDRAGALLRRAHSLTPNNPEILYEVGKLEQARGHERQAVQAFEQAAVLARGAGASGGLGRSGALGPNPFRLQATLADAQTPNSVWGAAASDPVAAFPASSFPSFPTAAGADGVTPGLVSQPATPASAAFSPALVYAPGMTPPGALGSASLGSATAPPIETLRGPVATPAAPLSARIERELAQAQQQAAARLEGGMKVRIRSGEEGSSQLNEVSASGTVASASLGHGRLSATITPVAISAGVPSGDAALRVGVNPLIAGTEIVRKQAILLPNQPARSASGAAVSVAYDSQSAHVDVGATPIGFRQVNISGGVTVSPQLGPVAVRATVEQRPVTDSVLAYAGDKDALTGIKTGPVTRQQVGLSASTDFGGSGLYTDLAAKRYDGRGIKSNDAFEFNAGAYFRPLDQDGERVQVGLNINLQGYERNLRFFTLGHGGYFSPQQFVAASVPITYSLHRDKWWLDLNVSPGLQSYHENRAPIFPSDAALQAQMITLAAQNSAVAAYYPADSRTGFGISGVLRGEYKLTPLTVAGAMVQFDTFGRYSESVVSVYVKQLFAQEDGSNVLEYH